MYMCVCVCMCACLSSRWFIQISAVYLHNIESTMLSYSLLLSGVVVK